MISIDITNTSHVEIELVKLLGIIQEHSPKVFINQNNELIVVPSWNIYFGLYNVETPLNLKCKVVEFLSRPSHKGVSNYWQRRVGSIFNEYLGTQFTKKEFDRIYTYLGNGINHNLTIEFVESGYDLNVLPEIPAH